MELLHGLNQSSANFSSKGRGGGMDVAATGVEVAVDVTMMGASVTTTNLPRVGHLPPSSANCVARLVTQSFAATNTSTPPSPARRKAPHLRPLKYGHP
jgi:hypothetical protein